MRYTEKISLVTKTATKDSIGNIVYTETTNDVYAMKNYVGSKEFYSAVAIGITPVAQLQIRLSEYNNQQEVIYNNVRYSVIRTIPVERFDIVLVLANKESNNG